MPWRQRRTWAIHLADSHVPFEGEVRAFEFRLHAGRLELSGFSTDGIALPVTAHNRNVTWAMTAGGPDVADCLCCRNRPRQAATIPLRWRMERDDHEARNGAGQRERPGHKRV